VYFWDWFEPTSGDNNYQYSGNILRLGLSQSLDGWDWNAGILGGWRGLSAGLYVTELDKGSAVTPASLNLYNYRKFDFALGYSGNFHDVLNGHVLRTQITSLEREQQQLRLELAHRTRLIGQLQTRLAVLEQSQSGDVAKQRDQLEKELQAERDAIQKANDRLKQLQGGQPQ